MTIGFEQNILPSSGATSAALLNSLSKAIAIRVLLVVDVRHRESLTNKLSDEGLVVEVFSDRASLPGALADAGNADAVVID